MSSLSREPAKNIDYIKNKQNKLLQNSVFFYKNTVMISLELLVSSLMSLINNVFYNNIDLKEFSIELEKVHKEINEEFEIEIYELLRNSLTKNIFHDFTKFGDKPPYVEPPGQIDILLYYQHNLYVIECKNYELKTNISAVANEVKRIQNDEIGKLEKKINFVKEHLKNILPLIGVDVLEAGNIKNITGLFVTKNFSMGELFTDQFPVINCSSLIKWIKSKE